MRSLLLTLFLTLKFWRLRPSIVSFAIVLPLGLGVFPIGNFQKFQAFGANDPTKLSRAEKRKKDREEREKRRRENDARSRAAIENGSFAGGNSSLTGQETDPPKPPSPGEIARLRRISERQARAERRNREYREAMEAKAQLEIQVRELQSRLDSHQVEADPPSNVTNSAGDSEPKLDSNEKPKPKKLVEKVLNLEAENEALRRLLAETQVGRGRHSQPREGPGKGRGFQRGRKGKNRDLEAPHSSESEHGGANRQIQKSGAPAPSKPEGPLGPFSKETYVNQFIADTLKKDPLLFNPSLKRADEIKAGLVLSEKITKDADFNPLTPETLAAIEKSGFADSSLDDLAKIFRILGHTNYNCSFLVGEPGVGKSFTLEQVIYMLSFGVMPKALKEKIGLEFSADKSPYFKLFPAIHEAFIGKTQIITVNGILLSFDNTPPGQAWAKAVDRAKHVLMELFENAEKDFREHGIRTLFVMEEMAQFDEHLFDTIKILFDRTGFKTLSEDPLVRGKDPGFSILGLTTFKERDLLFQNVKALPIARRMHNIEKHEPPVEEVIKIAKKKAEMLFYTHGILLEDGVIEYLIHKAKLLFNQPEAMPGSILKAMDNLVGWASDKRKLQHPQSATVSLYDVNKFFITEVMKLPAELWLPSETNPVPFQNLAAFIAEGFVDHPYVRAVDKVSWLMRDTINRGFDVLPFLIVAGPTGAGKNTLVSRLSMGVFGHDSDGLRISIAGMDEDDIRYLFEGSANSNEMPEIFTRIQRNPNGFIILDEFADAKPGALNYLKVLLDKRGRIQPKTPGAREYTLGYHGIVLTGQAGQEYFDQLTSERAIDDMLYDLGERLARKILLEGKYISSNEGGLDPAIIDRSVKDGAAIALPPVSKSEYPEIISRQMRKVLIPLHKNQRGFEISFDRDFVYLVDEINANIGSQTRELEGLTDKIIGRSLVSLNELGAEKSPSAGAKIQFSADPNLQVFVVKFKNPGQTRWKTVSISPNKILVVDCKLILRNALGGQGTR